MSILRKLKPGAHIKHFWRAIAIIAVIGAVGVGLMAMLRQSAPPTSQAKPP